jgi:hypothetical protein
MCDHLQELTLESGTGRLTGQGGPHQDRVGRAGLHETSRTGQDEQDRMLSRTGRAQVSRSDDFDLDLVAFLELETKQSESGFI